MRNCAANSSRHSGYWSVIWGCARLRSAAVPFAVGAYIMGAYWFTASTSFANPAVTLARAATDTFSGIRPEDVARFTLAQLGSAAAATVLFRWLVPAMPKDCRCRRGGPRFEGMSISNKNGFLFSAQEIGARSQMAEGLLKHDGGELFEVESAGTRPGVVRPEAITVLREIGIAFPVIAQNTSTNWRDGISIM